MLRQAIELRLCETQARSDECGRWMARNRHDVIEVFMRDHDGAGVLHRGEYALIGGGVESTLVVRHLIERGAIDGAIDDTVAFRRGDGVGIVGEGALAGVECARFRREARR